MNAPERGIRTLKNATCGVALKHAKNRVLRAFVDDPDAIESALDALEISHDDQMADEQMALDGRK